MPEEVPWRLRTVIGLTCLIFLSYMLMIIVVALVSGGKPGLGYLLLITALGSLFMLAGVWCLAARGGYEWRKYLGLRMPRWRTALPMVVGLQVLIYILLSIYSFSIERLGVKAPSDREVFAVFGSGLKGLIVAVFLVSILAPFTEELFFRGLLFPALRQRMPLAGAAVISGSVFAFFHLVPALFVPYVVIGAALAVVYEANGSIIPAMALHSLNNTVALLFYYFYR